MKILFITTRNPYAVRFSGDVMRASRIIKLLRNKYNTDVLFLGKKRRNFMLLIYSQENNRRNIKFKEKKREENH